jgi:hypothetical protein
MGIGRVTTTSRRPLGNPSRIATDPNSPTATGPTAAERAFERLCWLGLGRTGSDRERRAANAIAAQLEERGRRTAIEPICVHPQWPAIYLLHCLLAIAGSLLATAAPAVGFVLVLIAAASLYLDLSARWYLLRRLFFRRASQNLISPPLGEQPGPTVLLCAHYDVPLTGAAYDRWARRAFAALSRLWPGPTSPQSVIFWSIALLLPALGLRLAGVDADWVAVLQLPQTLILITAAFMLGEIGLSSPSPGANDNTAGVTAALLAAERLEADPPAAVTVRLLLCAAGESTREGARSFIRAHRAGLDRDQTWLIDIDSPGVGTPRFVSREMPVLSQPLDGNLIGIARTLAEVSDAAPSELALGPPTAASVAAAYRYPALALTAREGSEYVPARHHTPADRPDSVEPGAIDAVAALAVDIVRLLDREVARRTVPDGAA